MCRVCDPATMSNRWFYEVVLNRENLKFFGYLLFSFVHTFMLSSLDSRYCVGEVINASSRLRCSETLVFAIVGYFRTCE